MNSQDIVLSDDEQVELNRRILSATISRRDGRRTRVIFLVAQGRSFQPGLWFRQVILQIDSA